MKKMMIILGLMITTNAAIANITNQAKIQRIYAYQDIAIMYFNKKITTRCSGKNHLIIKDTRNTGKAMYAAALSAKQGGNAVWIGHSKCTKWGRSTLGTVYSVIIAN